jgi:hypothetical protein
MEKLRFLSDSLEPMSCHLSTRPRVAHQTSPNQTTIDKRGIKTIFNHFRDKPAREPELGVHARILGEWKKEIGLPRQQGGDITLEKKRALGT